MGLAVYRKRGYLMGGKTYLKPARLVLILVATLLIYATSAYSIDKCCIKPDGGCFDISLSSGRLESECSISASSSLCGSGSHPECNKGCCCGGNTVNHYLTDGECDLISGATFSNSTPYVSNPSDFWVNYCNNICNPQVISACTNTTCNGPNSGQCDCGGMISPPGQWCCAGSSPMQTIFSTQSSCLLSSSCHPVETLTISGVVSDATTTVKLEGVVIKSPMNQAGVRTNTLGYYSIQIQSGSGFLTATHPDYITKEVSYNTLSSLTGKDIQLTRKTSITENCSTLTPLSTDNDRDGCVAKHDFDCNGTGTVGFQNESAQGGCLNGRDDDCNGLWDCADPSCSVKPECTGTPQPFCGDTFVNQGWEECDTPYGTTCTYSGISGVCIGCRCEPNNNPQRCGDGNITGYEECDPGVGAPIICQANEFCAESGIDQCKCVSQVSSCGNYVLEPKYAEQCEFADISFNSVKDGSSCSAGQCIKPGFAGACKCKTVKNCGNGAVEPQFGEQCDRNDATQCAGKPCDLATCKCEACDITSKTPQVFNASQGNKINVSWTVSCPYNLTNFTIGRCTVPASGVPCAPTPFLPAFGSSVSSFLVENGTYCYNVMATYLVGATFENINSSNQICLEKKALNCTNNPTDWFCEDNKVKQCVNGNKINKTDCTPINSACIDYMPASGNARCINQSQCDFCNGWFEMFSCNNRNTSGYDIRSAPSPDVYTLNTPCQYLRTCFVDYTTTSVDKYYPCSDVNSCYDYNSEYACNQNRCQINGADNSCEWKNSTNFGELGIGVCRPKDVEKQDCGKCNQKSVLNKFYGDCDKNLCSLYGKDCYYPGETSIASIPKFKCLNKWEMACDFYTSSEDCTGGVNSSINVNWNIFAGIPVDPFQGTNNHIAISKDPLNFTFCRWKAIAVNLAYCIKDGNGDLEQDCINRMDESCKKDITPPVSSIIYLLPLRMDLRIPFNVFDAESNNDTFSKYLHYKNLLFWLGMPK